MYFVFDFIKQADRPDRFERKRDDKYHADFTRYCIYNGFDTKHKSWLNNIYYNRNFWAGNQWIYTEDLEAFFKDTSNQSRNRIKVIKNYIRRIVAQYQGNAEAMDITVRAESLSYKAINRREEKLAELMHFTDIAQQSSPEYAAYLERKMPIGNSRDETERIFENSYVDQFVSNINNLLEYNAQENGFRRKQSELALDLCLSGMTGLKYSTKLGEFTWKRILPERYFFDRSAIEHDLSDAEFMGDYEYMLPSEIFEKYNIRDEELKKHIDGFSRENLSATMQGKRYIYEGRIAVFSAYWVDFETYEYGYVRDPYDYIYLTRINYKSEGMENPEYTDKDLVSLDELTPSQKDVLNGKNKAKLNVDVIRYADMIPYEICPNPKSKDGSGVSDIVLDYGVMPYQEVENHRITKVKFPYKVYCWEYDDGCIYTPISELINPQRIINRMASVEENLMNTALPKNVIYDKQVIEDEEELLRNKYAGKPQGINARGMGVHNVIGTSESSLDNSIQVFEGMTESYRITMNNIVGVNESLLGESIGQDQLVGVTALQIQRASLVQEPFYKALVEVYRQAYEATANAGKRVYLDNPRKMSIIVGDKGLHILELSEDQRTETYRCFVNRQPAAENQKMIVNQTLDKYMQLGLISDEVYIDLYNNDSIDEVIAEVKSFMKMNAVAKKQAAEQMAAKEQSDEEFQKQLLANEERRKEEERIDQLADNQKNRDNKKEVASIHSTAGKRNL